MDFLFPSLRIIFGWNVVIRCIDFLILAIIWTSYMRSKRLELKNRKFFIGLMSCATLNLVLDSVAMVLAYHSDIVPEWINVLVHRLFFVSLCWVMCSIYFYFLSMENRGRRFFSMPTLIRSLPFVVCAIALFKAECKFHLEEDGAYVYGPIVNVVYIGVFLYFLLAIVVALRNYKKWNREQLINIFTGFVIWIGFAYMQMAFKTIILSSTGLVFILLLNYLVFEDPKVYINLENGNFNEHAYRLTLDARFDSQKPFSVFHVTFSEFSLVHGKYGHDVCQQILQDLAKSIEMCTGAHIYSIEEESLAFFLDMGDGIINSMLDSILEKTEYNWKYNENTIHVTGILYQVNCPEEAASSVELEGLLEFMKNCSIGEERLLRADGELLEQKRRYAIIVQMLEHAIYNDGFEMVYQPIYSTKDKSFHSAEALIRLKDKETLGFVSPEEFITIAEKEGMIMKVGEIVLSKVCSFAKENHLIERGIRYIEVNLSGIQCIDQGLPQQIEEVVEKYDLPFNFLNLEITETAAVESGEMLSLNMDKLTDKGVAFSMDDFGTGYSNLAQMADVSYDLIKIDKSLIWYCYPKQRQLLKKDEADPMSGLEKSRVVLAKVIKLIDELNLKIVAEGVETKEMVDMLVANGVDYLQGYYYSKPLGEKEYVEFLNNQA